MLFTAILLFGKNKHSSNTEQYIFWQVLLSQMGLVCSQWSLCGQWTSDRVGACTWRSPSLHAALGNRLNHHLEIRTMEKWLETQVQSKG